MAIYLYNPLPNIGLGYAQERICDYLKEHDEATTFELYKLSSKQSKPLNQLSKKGIVIKNEKGMCELRKEVAYYGGCHQWYDTIKEVFKREKPQWLDLKEIEALPEITKELLEKGIYIHKEYYVDFLLDIDNKEQPIVVSHDF